MPRSKSTIRKPAQRTSKPSAADKAADKADKKADKKNEGVKAPGGSRSNGGRRSGDRGASRVSVAKPKPVPKRQAAGALFEALVALQARLRAPGGCPWDREQTHDSLRTYLVEETYEVLNALDSRDPQELVGELGDLLLQVIFHAELGREAGRFDIGDVIQHVHTKMVRRHPHVFGNEKAATSAEVLKNWEQIKAEERKNARSNHHKSLGEHRSRQEGILDGVSNKLPALLEAHQLTRKAAHGRV